jgi:hypothetical protein
MFAGLRAGVKQHLAGIEMRCQKNGVRKMKSLRFAANGGRGVLFFCPDISEFSSEKNPFRLFPALWMASANASPCKHDGSPGTRIPPKANPGIIRDDGGNQQLRNGNIWEINDLR